MQLPMLSVLIVTLLLFNVSYGLHWQDCNLQADVPALSVTEYAHFPDPEISSENHTIFKKFYYSGVEVLPGLKETVVIDQSVKSPYEEGFVGWETFFENSFDLCESHDICPISPNSTFTFVDEHTPSNAGAIWYRAKELYYSIIDNMTVGCLTVVYQTVV